MSINKLLLQARVQQFIREHATSNSSVIALQKNGIEGVSPAELANQIASRQKAKTKLPLYYATENILYPPTLNLEQSSSQATAGFKAQIIKSLATMPNPVVADLTGGFGADSYFISQQCSQLYHVEPNASLQDIARHNHQLLGAKAITYANQTAEEFVSAFSGHLSLFFIDPSRRKDDRKVYGFQDCDPDVLALQPALSEKAVWLLIKGSPLLDIRAATQQLLFVKKVFVVSVDNECKELLFLCDRAFRGEFEIQAVDLDANGLVASPFSFYPSSEASAMAPFSDPLAYLYEPNASLLKAGSFKLVATTYGLSKLAIHTHLYTGNTITKNFPGRIFKVLGLVKPDAKTIRSRIPDGKANVLTRNYPVSADALKKKLKLTDGGGFYVLAFSGIQKKYVALCERIQ
jgi:hypothetical protein